jgi:hypothetical protein
MQVTITIPDKLAARIKADADRANRSLSAQAKYCLMVHYGDLTIGDLTGGLKIEGERRGLNTATGETKITGMSDPAPFGGGAE